MPSTTERRRAHLAPETARIRILAVDDQPEILRVLERFLAPHVVVGAGSAASAMTALAASEFDVVVSDYDMPGTDGVSLLTRVATAYPRVRRILFSGRTPLALGELRVEGIIHEFVEKPAFAEVVEACDHVAATRRDGRAR